MQLSIFITIVSSVALQWRAATYFY